MSKTSAQPDDQNSQCDHRVNPDTLRFVRAEEDGYEVEGICLDCGDRVYDRQRVEEMATYKRGGF